MIKKLKGKKMIIRYLNKMLELNVLLSKNTMIQYYSLLNILLLKKNLV